MRSFHVHLRVNPAGAVIFFQSGKTCRIGGFVTLNCPICSSELATGAG